MAPTYGLGMDAADGERDWRAALAGWPRPRVIATDLDGTLLRSDGTVSARSRVALERWVEQGGGFVLVTARPPRWLTPLLAMVGHGGVILATNGAFVVDAGTGQVVDEHPFEPGALGELIAVLRSEFPGIVLAAETPTGMVREEDFPSDPRDAVPQVVPDLRRALTAHAAPAVGKLLARCPGVAAEEVYALVEPAVGELAHLAYSGAAGLLEFSAPGVSKAAALAAWCEQRGHDAAQVWACGDMPNDLPMLEWAARALAPENAHPDVVAVADVVVPHHDLDGVAQVVEAASASGRGA